MFYSLTGVIIVKDTFAVVNVGGVGYRVFTSSSTLAHLKNNEEATLYTYLSVKEDSMTIYGFSTEEELATFKMLISVSGVGPKAGISILSALTPQEFAMSVATNEPKSITKAQGVGKKLAEKIIVELKDKLKAPDLTEMTQSDDIIQAVNNNYVGEAINALMVLGYSAIDSKRVVESCAAKATDLESLIKASLKKISSL